jgi:hypothetical protein
MEGMFLNLAMVLIVLMLVGIVLTAYEFREHITKRFKKK